MLIAEELVLLTLGDATGRPVGGLRRRRKRDVLIGGALLAELALNGSVDVRSRFPWLSAKMYPVTAGPPADALLQRAFTIVKEKPRPPRALVGRIGYGQFDYLAGILAGRGVLRRAKRTTFLVTSTFSPVVDPRSRQAVRDDIAAVLLHGVPPDERTGTLIALLSAVDQAHRLFVSPSVRPRVVKRRAKQIARAGWAAEAVRNAVVATRRGVEFSFDSGFGDGGDGDGGGGGD
ncbi:GOLPH3/VPS74 family protein [Nocardioides sp. YJ-D4]